MGKRKELEIVRHTAMNHLEIFLLEMILRQPHGHDDLEIGILWKEAYTCFWKQNHIS